MMRIVVLGGGFGGLYTARRLALDPELDVVLVSRENYFLVTPLLFEVCADGIEARHSTVPIRPYLRRGRFLEATVERVDLEQRIVHASSSDGSAYAIEYDQLVFALGATPNRRLIAGACGAHAFKTLGDALVLRNHVIECFERAAVEPSAERRRNLLTFVVIGGGLVGVELMGELTAFTDRIARSYPPIARFDLRFVLVEAGVRILPEVAPGLAAYARRVLERRLVEVRTAARVGAIEAGRVVVAGEAIDAGTIVLAAGVTANAVDTVPPLDRDAHGRIIVEPTMRSARFPNVWALGDVAMIPGPDGKPFPTLAQHALRESRVLAANIRAVAQGRAPEPFTYRTLGVMAALGRHDAIGMVIGIPLRGLVAWLVWRAYYLFQMPRWSRRIRLAIDWAVAALSRPDIVKLDVTLTNRG